MGMTHQTKIAPPVKYQSVIFIATSIAIIEIMLIPIAVLNARDKFIPSLARITVSSAMLVSSPLIIASDIIAIVGQGIAVS